MKMFCGHPFGFSQTKMQKQHARVKWRSIEMLTGVFSLCAGCMLNCTRKCS
jgi:hypothetical protein